eukprot:TRINITY_DN1017_c0_g1_i9.p1 TRINITY_DN1017_c0_g1~~TRINITY_DN1017_c0_g1_i9.p1  ORF type:complete len:660 (-),score=210.52 TRINITY_DN1017_c0_g1_i9:173-2152(-)
MSFGQQQYAFNQRAGLPYTAQQLGSPTFAGIHGNAPMPISNYQGGLNPQIRQQWPAAGGFPLNQLNYQINPSGVPAHLGGSPQQAQPQGLNIPKPQQPSAAGSAQKPIYGGQTTQTQAVPAQINTLGLQGSFPQQPYQNLTGATNLYTRGIQQQQGGVTKQDANIQQSLGTQQLGQQPQTIGQPQQAWPQQQQQQPIGSRTPVTGQQQYRLQGSLPTALNVGNFQFPIAQPGAINPGQQLGQQLGQQQQQPVRPSQQTPQLQGLQQFTAQQPQQPAAQQFNVQQQPLLQQLQQPQQPQQLQQAPQTQQQYQPQHVQQFQQAQQPQQTLQQNLPTFQQPAANQPSLRQQQPTYDQHFTAANIPTQPQLQQPVKQQLEEQQPQQPAQNYTSFNTGQNLYRAPTFGPSGQTIQQEQPQQRYNVHPSQIRIEQNDSTSLSRDVPKPGYTQAPEVKQQQAYYAPQQQQPAAPAYQQGDYYGGDQGGYYHEQDEDLINVTEHYSDGSMYVGQKKNDLRHGQGKLYYVNGGVYDGKWFEGKMEGEGSLYFASGNIAYEGEFRDDKFEGRGILYNEEPDRTDAPFNYHNFEELEGQWIKYEGSFVNDAKEGQGILYMSNNERYEGSFQNDMIHGNGKYYTLSNEVIVGVWDHNRLRQVIMTMKNEGY